MEKQNQWGFTIEEVGTVSPVTTETVNQDGADDLATCPQCNKQTLRIEGGCNTCLNEECGWSKCDV